MGKHAAPRKRPVPWLLPPFILAAALVPSLGSGAAPGTPLQAPLEEAPVTASAAAVLSFERPAVGSIPAPPRPAGMSFTAFLAAFEGTRTVLPGYSTAECVAIFQRYNALVVRGDGYGAVGAQNLWTDNSWTAYSRVPATEPAQRGDVVIWSGSSGAYLGGGYGHVAIVVTDNGPTLAAFGQNPNPATILTLSKSGVLGYLRPHAINP